MELKEGIKQINQSVTQSSASDATLEGYMLELKDANGNLVDKQPVSKLESLVYNYLTTKRQSELATAVGGNQTGNADGFVKFINTFIDDTIDEHRPNGIFPLLGESSSNRGFVFRFYSNKHSRAIEIRFVENQFPDFRINTSGQWGEWIQTPYYLKDYPDIASLSKGVGGLQKSIYQNRGALENAKITLSSKEKGDYADVYVYNYGSFSGNEGSMHKILVNKTGVIEIAPIISNGTTSLTKLDDDSVSVPLLEYSMLVVYSNMDITIQKL